GAFPMRRRGLEPPRAIQPTRPSTLRVYQFRHRRRWLAARPRAGSEYSQRLIPSSAPATFPHTCSYVTTTTAPEPAHGPDQAPAGDLRLHQALLGQVRLSADRARHRQGRRPRVVVDRPRPPRKPRAPRPPAARPDEAARDRAARPCSRRRGWSGRADGREGPQPRAPRAAARRPGRRGPADPRRG